MGRALFIRRESAESPKPQITSQVSVDKYSFSDKMRFVINQHNFNIGDLHSRFETIAGAFDQDRNLSKQSHKLYNERILLDLDKELEFLDKLGVSQTTE